MFDSIQHIMLVDASALQSWGLINICIDRDLAKGYVMMVLSVDLIIFLYQPVKQREAFCGVI